VTQSFLDWFRTLSWSNPNVRGFVFAVLATVALILILRWTGSLFRRLRERFISRIAGRQVGLSVEQWEVVSAGGFERSLRWVFGFFQIIFVLLLLDVYVGLVLNLFPASEPYSDQYFDLVTAPVVALVQAVVSYLPDLLYILVVSVLTLVLLRVLHLLFRALESGAVTVPGFYPDWADTTYKLIRVLALVFLLIAIFPRLPGADESAFRAVSLFIGALVTLGSTSAVANAVAGVVLIYTRAFQIGDWITVGATAGEVVQRTVLVTRLRTETSETVTIPNGGVLREHVVNYSTAAREGELGLTIDASIGYDVDWRVTEDLLLKAAAATPGVMSDPAPTVLQLSLDDFGISYRLVVRTAEQPPLARLRTALGRSILDAFEQAGVEILTPDVAVLRRGAESVEAEADEQRADKSGGPDRPPLF
jgi:small-conductance mechanosensitive channel